MDRAALNEYNSELEQLEQSWSTQGLFAHAH